MKKKKILLLASVLLIIALLSGGYIYKSRQLSASEIEKGFSCNRITLELRETDVFCGNPKFYNNPDSVSNSDYYKYMSCDERLKGERPNEQDKANNTPFYKTYSACSDSKILDTQRQEFIKELKDLKSKYKLA